MITAAALEGSGTAGGSDSPRGGSYGRRSPSCRGCRVSCPNLGDPVTARAGVVALPSANRAPAWKAETGCAPLPDRWAGCGRDPWVFGWTLESSPFIVPAETVSSSEVLQAERASPTAGRPAPRQPDDIPQKRRYGNQRLSFAASQLRFFSAS